MEVISNFKRGEKSSEHSILSKNKQKKKKIFFQQKALTHAHCQPGSGEYPPCSPQITSLDGS